MPSRRITMPTSKIQDYISTTKFNNVTELDEYINSLEIPDEDLNKTEDAYNKIDGTSYEKIKILAQGTGLLAHKNFWLSNLQLENDKILDCPTV